MIEYLRAANLVIANTFFEHHPSNKVTYKEKHTAHIAQGTLAASMLSSVSHILIQIQVP